MADGDGGFFRELLARNPGLGQVRADLAQCLLAEGQIEAAIAEATTALAGDASLVCQPTSRRRHRSATPHRHRG